MTFLLDPLMQTLGPEADNLSFLLQMTETIMAGQYRDATDGTKDAAKRLRNVVRCVALCVFRDEMR